MRVFNLMVGRAHGGLEQAAIDYAEMLDVQGVDTISFGHPSGWMRRTLSPRLGFRPLQCVTDYDPIAAWRLRRAVATLRPDLVLAHGTRAMRYAGRLSGVLKIGVLHNTRFKPEMARMDGFIAVSPRVAEAAAIQFPAKPIEIVPNMVRVGDGEGRPPFRDPPVIGSLGRLHPNKGFDGLLEALASPMLSGQPWRCVLGGDGPERGRLEAQVERLGLTDRVCFTGWVSDRHAFFEALDLFVLPSREEPFGIVLIEAMAEGLPVVVTDTDGPSVIVKDTETGLIVPREDPERLARAVSAALGNKADAARMGASGQRDVKARFSREAVAALLTSALDTLSRPHP